MARLLMLTVAVGLAGCFHAAPYSPQFATAKWRATQDPAATDHDGSAEPSATRTLSAEQTYELALKNNPNLAVLEAEAEVAEAQVKQAAQLENPQLRVTSLNLDDVAASQTSINVGVRVPIPRPGSVRARKTAAKLVAQQGRSSTDDAKRKLRARVYRRFAQLAMLDADLRHATEATRLAQQRRDHTAARLEARAATALDLALADVVRAEAAAEQSRVRDEIERVQAELGRLAGVSESVRFRVDPAQLRLVDVGFDRRALIEQAMRTRPELRAAHAGVGQAKAEAYLARNEAWPWFEWAQAQYVAGPSSTAASWGFGVALTLPVLSWNRGQIKATKARVRQREAQQSAEIIAVADEVDKAIERVGRTARRAHELQSGLLTQTEAAEREAKAALERGSVDPLIANEIATRGVNARRMHVQALFEHRKAVIELEAVVGAAVGRR